MTLAGLLDLTQRYQKLNQKNDRYIKGAATTFDSYSLLGTWRLSKSLNVAAWVGYGSATGQSSDSGGVNRRGDGGDLWTWNTNISFVDLGKERAVLTLAATMAPYAPFVEDGIADRNPPYVIQLQYLYPINEAITFTPGAFVVLNPQGNSDNSAIWVGVLRTVFQF